MKERGQGRPDQKSEGQRNSHLKEQGKALSGFVNPQPEQEAHGGGKSPESQPLPNVWDILKREVRLDAPDIKDRPRAGSEEYRREMGEISRLQEEMEERGTPRDQLISDLFYKSTMEPASLPVPVDFIHLSLKEFRQFRSKVEPMSDDEIREEIRKAKEVCERKGRKKEGGGGRLPGIVTP